MIELSAALGYLYGKMKASVATISVALVAILLLAVRPSPAAVEIPLTWTVRDRGELASWSGDGVQSSEVRNGALRMFGGERVHLVTPPDRLFSAAENPYLRLRLRTESPRWCQFFLEDASGRAHYSSFVVSLAPGDSPQTYWINAARSANWRGEIRRVGMLFSGHPGWLEFEYLQAGPFDLGAYLADNWRLFMQPRLLNLASINSLSPPFLFNSSLIAWLNSAAVPLLLIGVIIFLKSSRHARPPVALRLGLLVLLLWLAYDLRDTYAHYQTFREVHRSYVAPPPHECSYPQLGDFYRFVELCRRIIPPDSQYQFTSLSMWPFDCRINYFLYPRRINSDTWANIIPGRAIPYYLVYRHPMIHHDAVSGRLLQRDNDREIPITERGELLEFLGAHSLIFRAGTETGHD